MPTDTIEKQESEFEFDKSMRCDRCGAAAMIKVELLAGNLMFCGHHGSEHATKLKEVAVSIFDPDNKMEVMLS